MSDNTVKDHLGQTYKTTSEMCKHYDLPLSTFNNRILRGWSLEQALTIDHSTTKACKIGSKNGKKYKDHLGNEFNTISAMCEYHGITDKIYWGRVRCKACKDWSLEKILTEPVSRTPSTTERVKDHLGNEFESKSAMCRHYGIKVQTYRERRKLGFSVKDALTKPTKHTQMRKIKCKDHLGNEYESLNAMCRAYGMTRYRYQSRLDLGWSVEKALTTPLIVNHKECTDYRGRQFPTLRDMANYYDIPQERLQGKKSKSDDELKKIIKTYYKPGKIIGPYEIIDCVDFPYYIVKKSNRQYVIHFEQILNEYHKTFNPICDTKTSDDRFHIVRLIRFPYYLVSLDDHEMVWSYWQIIKYRTDTNFGLMKG